MYGEVVARPGIHVADGVHRSLRKTARRCHHHGHSRCGGNKILHGQTQHLYEVTQRRLSASFLGGMYCNRGRA
jgi:hypothetical protein